MKKIAIGLILLMAGLIPAIAQDINVSNISNVTNITDGNITNVTGANVTDNITNITGNETNVTGNVTNLTGNSTLLNGLVAYYPEDNESNHNDAADAHHGVFANGTTAPTFTTGKVNGAYAYSNAFSANDSRINANISELLNATSATVSAWINIQNNTGLLIQLYSNQPHGSKNLLRLDDGRVAFDAGNGLEDETLVKTLAPVSADWHYYTLQWDKSTGLVRIYLDGVLQEQLGVRKFAPETDQFVFGAGFDGYGASSTLDEIAIWTRLLTPEEITQLYNNGTGMSIPLERSISNETNGTNQTAISVSLEAVPNITYIFTCNAQGFMPLFYDWDFGDNTTLTNSTNQTVTHQYALAGNFTVSCLARNDGTSGNATLPIGG